MILLVPVSPEIPKYHMPMLWPGLVLVLLLGIAYLHIEPYVERDAQYVDGIIKLTEETPIGSSPLPGRLDDYLQLRPLLEIAPAHEDWDFPRLIYANFIHGGKLHLILKFNCFKKTLTTYVKLKRICWKISEKLEGLMLMMLKLRNN